MLSTADFAIVLFTPDDVGALKDKVEERKQAQSPPERYSRTRLFYGKARARTCVCHSQRRN